MYNSTIMQKNQILLITVIGVIALIVGAVGGYYYGQRNAPAITADTTNQALSDQTQAVIDAEKAKLAELQNAANPFKKTYQNPFAQ